MTEERESGYFPGDNGRPEQLEPEVQETMRLHQEINERLDVVDDIESLESELQALIDNKGFFFRSRNVHALIQELLRQVDGKEERLRELAKRGREQR